MFQKTLISVLIAIAFLAVTINGQGHLPTCTAALQNRHFRSEVDWWVKNNSAVEKSLKEIKFSANLTGRASTLIGFLKDVRIHSGSTSKRKFVGFQKKWLIARLRHPPCHQPRRPPYQRRPPHQRRPSQLQFQLWARQLSHQWHQIHQWPTQERVHHQEFSTWQIQFHARDISYVSTAFQPIEAAALGFTFHVQSYVAFDAQTPIVP